MHVKLEIITVCTVQVTYNYIENRPVDTTGGFKSIIEGCMHMHIVIAGTHVVIGLTKPEPLPL